MSRIRRGLTLVELLVVIAIIVLVIALAIPAVIAMRNLTRMSTCGKNVKQIVAAMASYEATHQTLPPGRVGCDADETAFVCKGLKAYQRQSTSGFALILPQLDETDLYARLGGFQKGAILPVTVDKSDDSAEGWQSTVGATVFSARPKVFVCPSSRAGALVWVYGRPFGNPDLYSGTGTYAMCMGSLGPNIALKDPARVAYRNDGMFGFKTPLVSSEMRDGASQTFVIGEATHATSLGYQNAWLIANLLRHSLRSTEHRINDASPRFVRETDGRQIYSELAHTRGNFVSAHPGGAFFGFGDQHVQFINDQIDHGIYCALGTRNGGEVLRQNNVEEWEWAPRQTGPAPDIRRDPPGD